MATANLSTYVITTVPALDPPQSYVIHPHHRSVTPHKSTWSISEDEEFSTFSSNVTALGGYLLPETYGIRVANQQLLCLGVGEGGEEVVVAKFTRDTVQWHGYPYSHTQPKRCIPRSVLEIWKNTGTIKKSVYGKLLRKQPC